MTKENIVLYARLIRDTYQTYNAIEIAKKLKYIINFLDADDFLKANTYRYTNGLRIIAINSKYDMTSRKVLCAHELGHAVLNHPFKSSYKDSNLKNEYEANLFAVALLFDDDLFNMPIIDMSNYVLETILDKNIKPLK